MLRVMPVAAPTLTGCTFGVFDCGTLLLALVLAVLGVLEEVAGVAVAGVPVPDEVVDVLLPPPPPPPQAVRNAQTTTSKAEKRAEKRKADFMAWVNRRRVDWEELVSASAY
jgi:hypothetical protein